MIISSGRLKGRCRVRYSIMRLAVTSPIPGNVINSSEVAVLMFKQNPAAFLWGFDPDSFCFIREAELPLIADPAYLHVAKNEVKMINPNDNKMSFKLFVLCSIRTYRTYKTYTPSSSRRNSSLAKDMRGSRREIAR